MNDVQATAQPISLHHDSTAPTVVPPAQDSRLWLVMIAPISFFLNVLVIVWLMR